MGAISRRGVVTIIVVWVLTIIALVSIVAFALWRTQSPNRKQYFQKALRPAEYIIIVAFGIGFLLSGHITWAMVLEGSKENQEDFSASQVNVIAKVRYRNPASACHGLRHPG